MEVAGDSEVDLGEGITLRAYQTDIKKGEGPRNKISWGKKDVLESSSWTWVNWKMTFSGEKIDDIWIKFPSFPYLSNNVIQKCIDSGQQKIQLKDSSKNQGEAQDQGIEGTEIKLEIKEESCIKVSDTSNLKECEVSFSPNTNLKWKQGFQPKVRYSSNF